MKIKHFRFATSFRPDQDRGNKWPLNGRTVDVANAACPPRWRGHRAARDLRFPNLLKHPCPSPVVPIHQRSGLWGTSLRKLVPLLSGICGKILRSLLRPCLWPCPRLGKLGKLFAANNPRFLFRAFSGKLYSEPETRNFISDDSTYHPHAIQHPWQFDEIKFAFHFW